MGDPGALRRLRVERDERGVVMLTLNRPEKKNAIDGVMFAELRRVFEEVARSDSDRVLVVAGAGDVFCGGADLTDFGGTPDQHVLDVIRGINEVALALHQIPKPVIAKVDGPAVGAGCNLALGCDLIVASERASFCEIYARRGISLDFGGSWLLPRLVGLHKAKELALLAERIPAREAERIGLVNRVVPTEELDACIDDWAGRLAAGPPLALGMSKRLLTHSLETTLRESLDAEAMTVAVNASTEDMREAFQAFVEKRPPRFKGR
jgi:2-(1,2-epoxy-1,2-dihydrophenyl)acetyl-CoA isomerase